MSTLERLNDWLKDSAYLAGVSTTLFERRKAFRTTNGIYISIQMSRGHYCVVGESAELWNCPPSPLLMSYGDGQDPYEYVPLDVVAGYIDSLESLGENHDY
jgi:hypothetical protein